MYDETNKKGRAIADSAFIYFDHKISNVNYYRNSLC